MNQYELVFIVSPVLPDSEFNELSRRYVDFIKKTGGQIIHEENWKMRKLAYPIKKKHTGYYYLVEFEAPGDLLTKLDTEFGRDEKVIRYLVVRLDKYAMDYSERRRKVQIGRKQTKEKTEA